jgi:hypothetical protein
VKHVVEAIQMLYHEHWDVNCATEYEFESSGSRIPVEFCLFQVIEF